MIQQDNEHSEDKTIFDWLRKVQLGWELSVDQLAKIAHVEPELLKKHLSLSREDALNLPTLPAGFESVPPLVSIFKALNEKFPAKEAQNDWLTKENETLEGRKPIEVMSMSPAHLSWVSYASLSNT